MLDLWQLPGMPLTYTGTAFICPVGWNVAVVVLEVIHTPTSKCLRVDLLVAKATGIPATSLGPGIAVDAELQSQVMNGLGGVVDSTWKLDRVWYDAMCDIVPARFDGPAVILYKLRQASAMNQHSRCRTHGSRIHSQQL